MSLIALTMIGCTSKNVCERAEVKFPSLEKVEINSTLEIPNYAIKREDIAVNDGNVSMKIETFKKIKEGDVLKVKYLLKRLKVFIFGLRIMNEQADKFNKEFVNADDR